MERLRETIGGNLGELSQMRITQTGNYIIHLDKKSITWNQHILLGGKKQKGKTGKKGERHPPDKAIEA